MFVSSKSRIFSEIRKRGPDVNARLYGIRYACSVPLASVMKTCPLLIAGAVRMGAPTAVLQSGVQVGPPQPAALKAESAPLSDPMNTSGPATDGVWAGAPRSARQVG